MANLNKLTALLIGIIVCVLFSLSLVQLSHVYASLTIAFVLAYLLEPLVARLEKLGIAREWGGLLVLVIFFVCTGVLAVAAIPKILVQARELASKIPNLYVILTSKIGPISEQIIGYNIFEDVDKVATTLGEPSQLVKPLGSFVESLFSTTFRLVTTILGLLIIPLMAYYLLRAFPSLMPAMTSLFPKRHHKVLSEIRIKLHGVFGGFIRGQLVVSTILSVYYCSALSILHIRLALVLGIMAGFFNVIPYLGILSVLGLTLIITFINGATVATVIKLAIVFAIGMGMEGALLTPRIVGKRVGLGPLSLILALLVGGQLLGLTGMLIAVPLTAVAKVFLDVALENYRNSSFFNKR